MSIPVEIKAHTQKSDFQVGIHQLGMKVGFTTDKGNLINDQFETVQKHGFKWVVLSIFRAIARPFYALFGKDPYSYVRVDNVARNVLKYCELNKQHVDETAEKNVNYTLDLLNSKTKGKYNATITDVKSKIHQLAVETLKVTKAETEAKAKEAAAKAEADAKAKEVAAAAAAESVAKAKEVTDLALAAEQKIKDLTVAANAKEAAAKAEAEKKAQQEKAFEQELIAQQEALLKQFAEQKAKIDKQKSEPMTPAQLVSIQDTMNELQKISDEQNKIQAKQTETIKQMASSIKP
jgi:hypothetical protein